MSSVDHPYTRVPSLAPTVLASELSRAAGPARESIVGRMADALRRAVSDGGVAASTRGDGPARLHEPAA